MLGGVAFSVAHVAYRVAAVDHNAIDGVAADKPAAGVCVKVCNRIPVGVEALFTVLPAYRVGVAQRRRHRRAAHRAVRY